MKILNTISNLLLISFLISLTIFYFNCNTNKEKKDIPEDLKNELIKNAEQQIINSREKNQTDKTITKKKHKIEYSKKDVIIEGKVHLTGTDFFYEVYIATKTGMYFVEHKLTDAYKEYQGKTLKIKGDIREVTIRTADGKVRGKRLIIKPEDLISINGNKLK